ncbi:MAG: MATE family efflux transporter [Lachnospiraceae bacterium]|nr:MATE family efflux transporter [Lachnospiraceae bacterium]
MSDSLQSINRRISGFVLPIAVQNLLASLVSVSDALMLGMFDQNALSAVSLATQVQFVLNLFFSALTVGMTILAAQYWGKRDIPAMERLLGTSLQISVGISTIFFLSAQCFPGIIMRIFTSDKVLIRTGTSYLRIASWSYLLMALPQVFLCMMKNSGRIIRSTLYGGIAVIINIVLNGIFIFGLFGLPAMGASGAAAATVIAIGAELLLVLAENITVDCVRIRRQYVKTGNIRLLKEFAQYSLPVLADLLVWGLGFTVFSIIISHMGNDAVAANSIANTAKNIISCFCLGLGGGTEIIIGNELGKNNLETAKWYGNRLLRLAAWTGVISGAVLVLSTPLYLGISASLSSRALEYLKWMLLICGFYMVGKSINVTLIDGVFCAGGDTRFGLWCDTVIMWLIIAPLGALAAFVIKLPVPLVYLILSLDECLKAPAAYMHYRKYQWVKNLT